MNRLQLCQALIRECAISGSMTTTVNQTGEFGRVVSWIDAAWLELQAAHDDWDFLRSSNILGAGASFTTVSGTVSYPLGTGGGTCGVAAATFGKWDEQSFRCYTTTTGTNDEVFLDPVDFDDWRNAYMYGAMRAVRTRPVVVAIGPGKSVCLGPPPTSAYTVTADYFIAPTAMAADADTPTGLPAAYHMAIVYKAMPKYGYYNAASEVIQRGNEEYRRLIAPLERKYMPRMRTGGALA